MTKLGPPAGDSALELMLEIVSGHKPWFRICNVRSDCVLAHTLPKLPLLAMLALMTGGGAVPDTGTTAFGIFGSLLATVMLPLNGPNFEGWKRIGTSSESPAWIVSGNESVPATVNTALSELIPAMTRSHPPLLLMVRFRSV